jgi:hypothetical protein
MTLAQSVAVIMGANIGSTVTAQLLAFNLSAYSLLPNAIGYAMHSSRSHDAVIRVYDDAGNVIEMHEHKGDFQVVAPRCL